MRLMRERIYGEVCCVFIDSGNKLTRDIDMVASEERKIAAREKTAKEQAVKDATEKLVQQTKEAENVD